VSSSHPEPARDFSAVRLLIRKFSKDRAWFRIHSVARDPVYFGSSGANRFDAPAGEFGVLYVGADAHCAFIETFGHATGTRSVSMAELRARALSLVTPGRDLLLVDLRGEGLARMGADASLASGHAYDLAQRWASAIHGHPRKPDGIVYRARHDPARTSAALFDSTAVAFTAKSLGHLASPKQARLLGDILDTYEFGLMP
jgi:hypothetical protein